MAKLVASETAGCVAERAAQILGGSGCVHESAAPQFREVSTDAAGERTSESERVIVAARLRKHRARASVGRGTA